MTSRENPPYQGAPLEDLRLWTIEVGMGKITSDEFLRRLSAREDAYRNVLKYLSELEIPDDMKAEVASEINVGRMGVEGLITAMDKLRDWVSGGSDDLREQALSLAESSTNMVNRAIEMNWEAHRLVQESAEEFLQQMGMGGGGLDMGFGGNLV